MASRIKNYFTTRKSVFYSMLILILLTLITDVINFNSAENKLVPSTLNVIMSCLFVIGWLAFAAVYGLQKEKRFVLILAIYFIIYQRLINSFLLYIKLYAWLPNLWSGANYKFKYRYAKRIFSYVFTVYFSIFNCIYNLICKEVKT